MYHVLFRPVLLRKMSIFDFRLRDQTRSSTDQLQEAAQKCETDQRAFNGAQRDVEAGLGKNLPEALAEVERKLKQTEEEINGLEREVESNKVCVYVSVCLRLCSTRWTIHCIIKRCIVHSTESVVCCNRGDNRYYCTQYTFL